MIYETPIYTLGAEGAVQWQGNVTDPYGVDWVVTEEDGWSSGPPVRPTQSDRSAGDGVWAGPGLYGARVITLSGRALAADRISMLRAKDRLKAAAGTAIRSKVPLLVEEEHLARQAMVRLADQVQITDQGARSFAFELILTADDPRRYAPVPTVQTTLLPASGTVGRTYNRTFNHAYGGGSGGTGRVTFVNEGDFDTCPATITISGPVGEPQVAHVESGRFLKFGFTLTLWEHLVIDLLNGTALLNGSASRNGTITAGSAWFMLRPGPNTLQFRGRQIPPEGYEPDMTVAASSAWT